MAVSAEQIEGLTQAINRLTAALKPFERLADALAAEKERIEVHNGTEPRYEPPGVDGLVDEATMAKKLDIPKRTLAQYRRDGRFPNCWVKNGRSVRWRVAETLEAWKRGIS